MKKFHEKKYVYKMVFLLGKRLTEKCGVAHNVAEAIHFALSEDNEIAGAVCIECDKVMEVDF